MTSLRPRPATSPPADFAGPSPSGLAGVRPADESARPAAGDLARALGLAALEPLVFVPGLVLVVHPDRLELRDGAPGAGAGLVVDFQATHARRGTGAGWRRDPLARAVGLRRHGRPTVLDATLGLGRDAWMLAALGCRVRGCERSPVVAALVADGLSRAARIPALAEIRARLSLEPLDARQVFARLEEHERPDVVLLDPMFPERRKSARVRKEMQHLQRLLGPDEDAADLLAEALRAARQRVVVKRPRDAAPLGDGPAPSLVVDGRSLRCDVYLVARDAAR